VPRPRPPAKASLDARAVVSVTLPEEAHRARQLQYTTTVTVTNQADLQAAIASDVHAILNTDMPVTTTITIGAGITGLKISSLKGDGTNAVLNGGGSTRILSVGNGAAVGIEGLDFENGKASGGTWQEQSGGCIYNDGGDLQIEASNFRNCVADVSRRVEEGGPAHDHTPRTHIHRYR
jgi:hypothetical protein